ncbi:MAG: pimeloyl-ACP methyl ester carboxylesterase [Gammaproteobacteria bacterium]|jgi:pimeloyl-ACP methyl ester carboxylesterase
MKQTTILFIAILSLIFHSVTHAEGTYEEEIVIRLVKTHVTSGTVWLEYGKNTFLSLYEEPADPKSNKAVLLLHSMGMHADWPEIISPLRKQLPLLDWATLSVQLPLLDPQENHADYGSTFTSANNRIRIAVRYLQNRGYTNIIMIGYSFGTTTAINYLTNINSSIKGLVGISMQSHQFLKPKYNLINELSKISIPILDIYADKDFTDVLKLVHDRRLAANKAGNNYYDQIVIEDADHYFTGKDKELISHISAWLNQLIPDSVEK